MAKQQATSINIDITIADAIDSRRRDGETRTARLAADLGAYHRLLDIGLRRARKSLTPVEASLILDAFNSTALDQAWPAERIIFRLEDAMDLDGVAEKWGVDRNALIDKLVDLGDISAIALADWAERIWGKGDFDVSEETEIFRG